MVTDRSRQTGVGVATKDDDVSNHVVDEVKKVVVSCVKVELSLYRSCRFEEQG